MLQLTTECSVKAAVSTYVLVHFRKGNSSRSQKWDEWDDIFLVRDSDVPDQVLLLELIEVITEFFTDWESRKNKAVS